MARKWLRQLNAEEDTISHVAEIIQGMSFKGAYVSSKMRTMGAWLSKMLTGWML